MNKRTSHGMIFVPLLCLLAALLGCMMFARAREDAAQPIASESVSEAVGIFQSPVLDMPEALASALIFDPLPSDEPVNTTPPVEEAEGESEYGQRLVIDTVLNRVDSEHFPNTVHDVVYQKNQYSSMTGERVTRCWVKEELCELVRSELKERTDYDVVFFRTKHYHSYGVPLFQVGSHYFSKYG